MIANRTELFNYHSVFDVELDGVHYYVYNLPYYDNMYVGRHLYPDGEKFYSIPAEMYVRLVTLKNKNAMMCQKYVEDNIDDSLISERLPYGFEYIGDRRDYIGSQLSALLQALVCKYHS